MKRIALSLMLLLSSLTALQAMSYEEARQQAWFLTDKMAYELNLTTEQYDRAYEINLDYLLGIQTASDCYGSAWYYRDADLRCIFYDWQYTLYSTLDYFYRPIRWLSGGWYYPIVSHYRYGYYYFDRPAIFANYRGGRWRQRRPGGQSPYLGMRPTRGQGMRDRYDGRGGRNNGYANWNNRPDSRPGNSGWQNNGRPGNNGGQNTGRPDNNRNNRNDGFGNSRPSSNNRNDGFGNSRPSNNNRNDGFGNSQSGNNNRNDGFGNSQSGNGNRNDGFGNSQSGNGSRNTVTTGQRSSSGRSTSTTRPSRNFGSSTSSGTNSVSMQSGRGSSTTTTTRPSSSSRGSSRQQSGTVSQSSRNTVGASSSSQRSSRSFGTSSTTRSSRQSVSSSRPASSQGSVSRSSSGRSFGGRR